MKILITGINGFIGKHLAQALLSKGYGVVGLGRRVPDGTRFQKDITYYSGSVLDKKIVEKAMQDIDVVIHLAALTTHKDIIDNKYETLETNFIGTKNILDVFSKSKIAKKFFYASTGKVYGKIIQLPISEDHQTIPLNVLGKSKLITEKLIDFYPSTSLRTSKKEFIIFRIFNVYGPGQKENFLISTILKQLDKKTITLGDIEAKRDYVFIDDLINAFVLAIEKKGSVGVSIYNICTGIGISAREIVEIIKNLTGKSISIKINQTLLRQDEMNEEYGSYEKAQRILSWKPKIGLATGITKLLQ